MKKTICTAVFAIIGLVSSPTEGSSNIRPGPRYSACYAHFQAITNKPQYRQVFITERKMKKGTLIEMFEYEPWRINIRSECPDGRYKPAPPRIKEIIEEFFR